ncbi:C6 zinc finger domain protein [Penicillium mononematosum]|uniref:C6 zinc finger domain protein n=1 Tax=Penicillium mononematosum TaxID=268346 RepID=UPI002547E79D|nr:C6 zinc finger domain protein [Penicillium mononematosum]KAJ6188708.1 C6 zinc finger domain protein [Penicillium mononematosum]
MPRRRSTGCIPCKLRRKKCDERKPTCVACARNVLLCAWDSGSHTSRPHNSDDRVSRTSQQPTRLVPASKSANPENVALCVAPALHPQLANAKTNFLYSFFYSRAAQTLSIKDGLGNPFIHVLMPLAAASDIVFQAMIAFSGVMYQQQHSASFAQATWEHYAQAIRSLKHALTLHVEHQADRGTELLATVLLLISLEVSKSDSDGHAFCHLQACRELVSGAFAYCKDSQLLGFLAEHYLYILSLLPTSSMESPDMIEGDIEFAFQTLVNNAVPATGVLCGCAPQMFRTIPKATEVSRRLYDEFTSEAGSSVQTLHEHHILYNYIQSWVPEGADKENSAIARVYQKALLVLLSQADPGTSDNPETEVLVANIVSLLRNIPVQSSTTTVLAWPLATVAPCVKSPADQAFILRYLGAVVQKYGFENHRQTERLLQLIWSRQDLQEQGPYCVPRAMEAQGFRFMLC